MVYLTNGTKEKLMAVLKNKDLYEELLNELYSLSEMDCLDANDKEPSEIFRNKIIKLKENSFLKVLEENELI